MLNCSSGNRNSTLEQKVFKTHKKTCCRERNLDSTDWKST